jgi:hypothetical protein
MQRLGYQYIPFSKKSATIILMRCWKMGISNCHILCRHLMNWSTMHIVNGIIMFLILLMTAVSSIGKSNHPLIKGDWVLSGMQIDIMLFPINALELKNSTILVRSNQTKKWDNWWSQERQQIEKTWDSKVVLERSMDGLKTSSLIACLPSMHWK